MSPSRRASYPIPTAAPIALGLAAIACTDPPPIPVDIAGAWRIDEVQYAYFDDLKREVATCVQGLETGSLYLDELGLGEMDLDVVMSCAGGPYGYGGYSYHFSYTFTASATPIPSPRQWDIVIEGPGGSRTLSCEVDEADTAMQCEEPTANTWSLSRVE